MKAVSAAIFVFTGVIFFGGCESSNDVPVVEYATNETARVDMEARHQAMIDEAMLHNMSLADIHFVPHTEKLNKLGEKRLRRYAELLVEYGGTLYLETASRDEVFCNTRMQNMMDFLRTASVAADRMQIALGNSAGRGMGAAEAITIKEAAFSPEQQENLTDIIGGGAGSSLGSN
jgi:hypothetical protein